MVIFQFFSRLKMVILHVKRGDESLFLYESTVSTPIEDVLSDVVKLHNGRLKVYRMCSGKV